MTKTATVLAARPRAESPNSGLSEDSRKEISAALGEILSATYGLVVKTHIHHWNVVGPLFHPLHVMLEEQYDALFEATDLYAERIRALGYLAPIPKVEVKAGVEQMTAEQMIADLLADHQAAVQMMRDAAIKAEEQKDIVTHDMLVAQMAWHEKTMWMLRSVVAKV